MTLSEAVSLIMKKMNDVNHDGKVTLNIELNILRYPFLKGDMEVRLAYSVNSIYRSGEIYSAVDQYLNGHINMQMLFDGGELIDANRIDDIIKIEIYKKQ